MKAMTADRREIAEIRARTTECTSDVWKDSKL